jgi:hypothetical protein
MARVKKNSALVGPDVILLAPVEGIVLDSFLPNAARRKRTLEHPSLDLYAGNERFLVRTALIRAEGWAEGKDAPTIMNGEDAAVLVEHLQYADQEHVVVLSMSAANKLLAIHEMGIGGTSSAQVETRHLVKVAMLTAASGVILVHNHPSGNPEPSDEDVMLTAAAKKAFACVGIQLLDHIIIAARGHTSLFVEGLM